METLSNSRLPGLGAAVVVVLATALTLALTGFVVRRFLWAHLTRIPVLATLTRGVDQVTAQLRAGGPLRRDRVVWVPWPNENLQTLGVVTGPGATPGETPAWLTVTLFSTAGHVTGGMLRRVRSELVTYPGWTIDEAVAFVSSSGAQDSHAEVSKRD